MFGAMFGRLNEPARVPVPGESGGGDLNVKPRAVPHGIPTARDSR
jgi:hypothetical protein